MNPEAFGKGKFMKIRNKIVSLVMAFVMVISMISSIPMKAVAGYDTYEVGRIEKTINVNKGDSLTLTVNPSEVYNGSAGNFYWSRYSSSSYGWYESVEANETTCELTDIQQGGRYECYMEFGYDWNKDAMKTGTVVFNIVVGTDFTCEEGSEVTLNPGESVTLTANATTAEGNTLSYAWYRSTEEDPNHSYGYTACGTEASCVVCQSGYYRCIVTDSDGNVAMPTYKVITNNNFNVVTKDQTVTVVPGVETTLAVEASCDTELTYEWKKFWSDSSVEGTSANFSFTIPTQVPDGYTAPPSYRCVVKDGYGNEKTVWFTIKVANQLKAKVETDAVQPTEKATLKVTASCLSGSLHYQWYQRVENESVSNNEIIEGATEDSYVIDALVNSDAYYCRVSDDYGNKVDVGLKGLYNNWFTCSAKQQYFVVEKGESVTLKVNASCEYSDLTYQWEKDGVKIDHSGDTLVIDSVSENMQYCCIVTDIYGNSKTVDFEIKLPSDVSDLSDDAISLLCWDDGTLRTYNLLLELHPELEDKVKIYNINLGGTDPKYLNIVASASAQKMVISAIDSSILDDVTKTADICSMNDLGITNKDYANAYPFTKLKGTKDGKLMAVTNQICTGNLFYRADIAEKVFGTSDPSKIEDLLNTPEKFLAAAKKLQDAGYYAFADDNFYFDPSSMNEDYDESSSYACGIDGCLLTDTERKTAHEFGRQLYENEYVLHNSTWQDTWAAEMNGDKVFAYNGCPWFMYSYEGAGNSLDKINFCQGPISYTWGGTYYVASSKCVGNDTAKAILQYLTCDADTMEAMAKEMNKGEMPNNKIALNNIANSKDALILTSNNQNVHAFYDRISSAYSNAELTPDKYTISYVLNGGKNDSGNPDEYASNASVKLKNPTKTGYTFAGWYTNAAFTGTAVTSVENGDVVLYAKWTPISYTIHFDKNTATSGSMKRVYPKYGRNYRLPACGFKKPGYAFAGWNTRKDGKGTAYKNQSNVKNLTTTNGKVIMLYAQWRKITVSTPAKPTLGNYAAGRLTVTCKAVKGADGYLIQYSTNKNMKNAKTVSSTTLKKNIYNLKKGTTYYVRVRAYKVDSAGKKVCGKYSAVQNKKITK